MWKHGLMLMRGSDILGNRPRQTPTMDAIVVEPANSPTRNMIGQYLEDPPKDNTGAKTSKESKILQK